MLTCWWFGWFDLSSSPPTSFFIFVYNDLDWSKLIEDGAWWWGVNESLRLRMTEGWNQRYCLVLTGNRLLWYFIQGWGTWVHKRKSTWELSFIGAFQRKKIFTFSSMHLGPLLIGVSPFTLSFHNLVPCTALCSSNLYSQLNWISKTK